jgi:phage terminase small subunit
MSALTNVRHERLAQERALGKSLTEAWEIASGRRSIGYASRLAKRPEVAARIAELEAGHQAMQQEAFAQAAARYEVTAERVIGELARIAFANLTDFVKVGPDGNPRPDFSTLTFEQGAALQALKIRRVKPGRGGAREVFEVTFKLADKRLALVALGQHLGLFAGERAPYAPASPPLLTLERMPTVEEWEAELAAGLHDR